MIIFVYPCVDCKDFLRYLAEKFGARRVVLVKWLVTRPPSTRFFLMLEVTIQIYNTNILVFIKTRNKFFNNNRYKNYESKLLTSNRSRPGFLISKLPS